jgi:hypothetical protein
MIWPSQAATPIIFTLTTGRVRGLVSAHNYMGVLFVPFCWYSRWPLLTQCRRSVWACPCRYWIFSYLFSILLLSNSQKLSNFSFVGNTDTVLYADLKFLTIFWTASSFNHMIIILVDGGQGCHFKVFYVLRYIKIFFYFWYQNIKIIKKH